MSRSRTVHFLGNLIHFHAFCDEREGEYCVVEARVAPGAGAPPHHHAADQETFFVVEGEVEFSIDGAPRSAGAGDVVLIPKGATHAFTNTGDAPARMFIVNAPGRMHEQFFTTVGEPLPEGTTEIPEPAGPPDIGALVAAADAVGMTILPPPAPPG